MIGFKGMGLLDAYRCLFGLSENASLARPRLPSDDERREACLFLSENGYEPGRTILFSCNARSTPIPANAKSLFAHLGALLSEKGYRLLNNGNSGDGVGSYCEIPLRMLRSVVLESGGFAMVRSGLCDLLCDLPVPGVIFYSDEKYLGGALYRGTSIARYNYPQHASEFEVDSRIVDAHQLIAVEAAKLFPGRLDYLIRD